MNNLKLWRFVGTITIIMVGFLLHYLYSWSGNSKIVGFFVPVNESVWEHLKLGYWSVLLFSIPEYLQINNSVNNYYWAKLMGVLALELTILIIYYSYKIIVGENILVIDIFSYIMGAIISQYLTYKIFNLKPFSRYFKTISVALFIALGVLFGVTTYDPPHLPIFKDNNTNTYGISKEN